MNIKDVNKGLSMIVLIIAFLVFIILLGTIILSLYVYNPINSAKENAFKSDMKAFETDLNIYVDQQYSAKPGKFSVQNLQADELSVTYKGTVIPGKTIKDIIPSLSKTDKYNGQLVVKNGKLVYIGTDSNNKKWSQDINISVANAENSDILDIYITTDLSLPITLGTDVICTATFSSNGGISNINLNGNIEVLDSNNLPVASQPIIEIGAPTGDESSVSRNVYFTIKTGTLSEGIYKVRIKSKSITTSTNITNDQDIISNILFIIDNTPPKNPTMEAIPTGWTNSNVTVIIKYSEDTVRKEYSINGTTWSRYLFPILIDKNDITVYARSVDMAGNQSGQSTLTVSNIDRDIPIVTFETNGAVDIRNASTKVTAVDIGLSGINDANLQYVWDTQNINEPTSGWTTFENGTIVSKSNISETYYLWIKAFDNAGNMIVTKTNAFVADIIPPTNPTMVCTPTEWTNGNVTVTIAYPLDAAVKEYSIDAVTWNTYTIPVIIESNDTTIYSRAIDAAGNQSGQSTLTVTNIDQVAPIVEFGTNGGVNIQNPSTTVTVSDTEGSNVNSSTLQYVWDTQNISEPTSGWTTFENGTIVTKSNISVTYYLWIKAFDNVGNKVVTKTNAFAPDIIPPTNPTMVCTPTEWTNGNVSVTITYSSDTAIKEYSTDGVTWNTYVTSVVVTMSNTIVYARGTDAAGNQSGQSTLTVANIDKTAPTVIYGTNGGSNLQMASTAVTVSDLGGSNVNAATLQYLWDIQNTVTPTSGWTTFTNGGIITKSGVTGTFYLWIKGSDNAGNSIIAKSNAFVTDVTSPGNPLMSATPTGWTNGNVTVTITYPADVTLKQYSTDGIIWNTYATPVVVATNNTTVYAKGLDAAGNQSGQSTLTVSNIDTTLPTTPVVNFNGYTPGTWTTSNITINLSSTDSNSGIQKYQWSSDGVNWTDITNTYVYNNDINQSTTYRSVDNSGNTSIPTVYYKIQRDTTAPTFTSLSILNISQDSFDIYVYGVDDKGSGVSKLQFQTWTSFKGQDDMVPNWNTSTLTSGINLGGGTWKYTVKRSEHLNEYGEYISNIYIYDNMGYTSNTSITGNIPDPTIVATFTFDSIQEVFNGNTSYVKTGEVSNNYTIDFIAQPTDTIDVLPENNTSNSKINNKHRFLITDIRGANNKEAGLGISLGTNGITIIASSKNYYHTLLTYYSNLSALNKYRIVVKNGTPTLYINNILVKTGFPPKTTYKTIYTQFSIAKSSYGNFIGKANNIIFYNVAK